MMRNSVYRYRSLRDVVKKLKYRSKNGNKYKYEFRDEFRLIDWIAYFKKHKDERFALYNCMNKLLMNSIQNLERQTSSGTINFNLIIIIRGKTGDGKSTAGDSIAVKVRDFWDSNIHNLYNLEDVIDKIGEGNPHDILIRDESNKYSGDGCSILNMQFLNLSEIMRFKGINLILIAPRTVVWELANLYLDACGMDFENNINRFLVWNPDFGYQGYITISKHSDEDLEQKIENQKDQQWDKMIQNKGLAVKSNLPKEEDIEKIIDYIKENNKYIKYKKEINLIIEKLEIVVNRYERENLILEVYDRLQSREYEKKELEPALIKRLNVYKKKEFEYEVIDPPETTNDPKFFDRICRNLKRQKKVEQNKIDVFIRKMNGEKFERIALDYDRSGRTISNWFDDVLQEVLGYVVEDSYSELLEVSRIKFIHEGGNSAKRDYFLPNKNEVISLKSQYKIDEKRAKARIGYDELKYAYENGSKLTLLLYTLLDKNFRKWSVSVRLRTPTKANHQEGGP